LRILFASQTPTFGIVRLLNFNHFSFMKQHLIRFSILISLMTNDIEYLHILTSHYYLFCMKCLFKYFAYILLNCWVVSVLYIFWIQDISIVFFFQFVTCIFIFLTKYYKEKKFFILRKPDVLICFFHDVCFGCPI